MFSLKKILENRTGKEINIGFEIIGDIAIIEDLNKNLTKEDLETISYTIKEHNPNVRIIALKTADVEGVYRVAEHKIIMSFPKREIIKEIPKRFRDLSDYETLHKEHGVRVLLDINKVYFSSKLGYERKRIKELVKEGERIFLPFAGIGIYGLVIAKHKNVEIDAVEINPYACEYMKKNLDLNKLKGRINVFCMNVKEYLKDNDLLSYDRIIMPAPKDAPSFLQEIVKKSKEGTYIHYYFFANKEEINKEHIQQRFSQYPLEIVSFRKAGSIGTNKYRVVVDFIKK